MKGWRGSPARHALAAKGVGVRSVQRPAAAVPMMSRPQRDFRSDIHERLLERAFSEAANSYDAERLLVDRPWLKAAILDEAEEYNLSTTEVAQIENTILEELGQDPSIVAGLIQVVDQLRPGV